MKRPFEHVHKIGVTKEPAHFLTDNAHTQTLKDTVTDINHPCHSVRT